MLLFVGSTGVLTGSAHTGTAAGTLEMTIPAASAGTFEKMNPASLGESSLFTTAPAVGTIYLMIPAASAGSIEKTIVEPADSSSY